jgi:hypothetical protein
MANVQDPIFYTQIECPICKNSNEYENIKVGSYSESGRDTDFCPTGRVWTNPAYQKYDPLLFFMATCKKCFYTREFNADYKNWQKDSSFKMYRLKAIQEKHLAEFLKEDGLVKFLGNHIDHNRYPFESAVIKFILGIYEEKLLDRPSKLDLGRYFLRIGWLFRTNKDRLKGNSSASSMFLNKLKKDAGLANKLLGEYSGRLKEIENLLGNDFGMLYGDSADAGKLKSQAESLLLGLTANIKPMSESCDSLIRLIGENEKALAPSEVSADGFYGFSSFVDYLNKAQRLWSEIPVNEIEALIKARDYYQGAYEVGDKISAGAGQIQAAYLIAELSRRTGNYANANSFFNQVIKTGRELVNGRKEDSSTINFAKKLLETAMEQARLSRKESEGQAV